MQTSLSYIPTLPTLSLSYVSQHNYVICQAMFPAYVIWDQSITQPIIGSCEAPRIGHQNEKEPYLLSSVLIEWRRNWRLPSHSSRPQPVVIQSWRKARSRIPTALTVGEDTSTRSQILGPHSLPKSPTVIQWFSDLVGRIMVMINKNISFFNILVKWARNHLCGLRQITSQVSIGDPL